LIWLVAQVFLDHLSLVRKIWNGHKTRGVDSLEKEYTYKTARYWANTIMRVTLKPSSSSAASAAIQGYAAIVAPGISLLSCLEEQPIHAAIREAIHMSGPSSSSSPWSSQLPEEQTRGYYLYRVLNKYEHPAAIRAPDDFLKHLTYEEKRAFLLAYLAYGHSIGPSPYCHVTWCLERARKIYLERKEIYNGCLVRFPSSALSQDDIIDLDTEESQQFWFKGLLLQDTKFLEKCLQKCKDGEDSDFEVLLMSLPPLRSIEYWSPKEQVWKLATSMKDLIGSML
jgi:hypothetical protein